MMKNKKDLIIVESPTKSRTLARFLGDGYEIKATMGHIRDLPQKKLGLEIQTSNNSVTIKPKYEIIPQRKERVAELVESAKLSNMIVLATDPDREGEAIAYHTEKILTEGKKAKIPKDRFVRIVFHEITKSALEKALANPRKTDFKLVDAQQARRILDRLVGYKLSPLLWNKLGKRWLSAGRVQTVAVKIIVEREKEIQKFKPVEYWVIEGIFNKKDKENEYDPFSAKFWGNLKGQIEITDGKEAIPILEYLRKSSYRIYKIEKKEANKGTPSPFTTSLLQQSASNRFGWSARRTMRIAQKLYEEGLITYHRTDSFHLSQEAVSSCRQFILENFQKSYLPPVAKTYRTKSKVAQEAHEAIRPTNTYLISKKEQGIISSKLADNIKFLGEDLGREAETLYSLIWKRFVSCQTNEARIENTNVSIIAQKETGNEDNGYLFKCKGQRIVFDGWLKIYGKASNALTENGDKILPPLSESEELNLKDIKSEQKFTQPPPRYTEAALIKILEEKGIGRPSTFAPIITTIQDRKYVEKEDKKFKPTDLGITVVEFLVKYFPEVFDYSFTANMEASLDDIANGEKKWEKVLGEFYLPFFEKIEKVFESAERVKLSLGSTDEKCPKCSSQMTVKLSKFGKFLACSAYPGCKFTKNIIEKAGIICPKCKGDIIIKKTRKGKQFYGCSNYPKCDFAAWRKDEIK